MTRYGQHCPIALASKILGERWTLLVVRELLSGSTRFNDIRRGVPKMSPSLLSKRLKELEEAGIVRRAAGKGAQGVEYCLTDAGLELRLLIRFAGCWAQRWARDRITRDDLDPRYLMWDVRRLLRREKIPGGRAVIYVEFSNVPRRTGQWWLVAAKSGVELSAADPGLAADVSLFTDVRSLTEVFLGITAWQELKAERRVKIVGSSTLVKTLPDWFSRSPFWDVEPAPAPPPRMPQP